MPKRVRFWFEIDSADPLTGRVRGADGDTPFAGWLGLMSAVESAIDGALPVGEAPDAAVEPTPTVR